MTEQIKATRKEPHMAEIKINEMLELVTRIDERMKNIANAQEDIVVQINESIKSNAQIISRLSVLESKNYGSIQEKIQALEIKMIGLEISNKQNDERHNNSTKKWSYWADFIIRIISVILVGALLAKLGLGHVNIIAP